MSGYPDIERIMSGCSDKCQESKMKTISEYLDEAKEKHSIKSDSELARQLGGSRQSVSDWRVSRSKPDDYACIRLAELLGINPLEIIAAANAEREADPERAKWWLDFSKRHGIKALSVSLIGINLLLQVNNLGFHQAVLSLYIMLSKIDSRRRRNYCYGSYKYNTKPDKFRLFCCHA